jgi:hypothetical protein
LFFHVDESGNSGNNLFDHNQPVLSYGVLSSETNVDVLASREHAGILRRLGEDSIHANQLGAGRILSIVGDLIRLHDKFDFHFDYYFIHKESYAVAMLFDAIFDAGLNEAVKWDWYWTPLRFPMVAAVQTMVDEDLLKEGWKLRLIPRMRIEREEARIVRLLTTLRDRLDKAAHIDKRIREILSDGLRFGIKNPLKLDFGTDIPKFFSPNSVGFQFVLSCIANRLKATKRKALKITLDRQSEFNQAQIQTYINRAQLSAALRKSPIDREWYLGHPLHEGVRDDAKNLISHFPEEKVTITTSPESFGLQLVDVYLWIVGRTLTATHVPDELKLLARMLLNPARIDGISIPTMMARFNAFEKKLPQISEISPELKLKNEELVEAHRRKVREMNLE